MIIYSVFKLKDVKNWLADRNIQYKIRYGDNTWETYAIITFQNSKDEILYKLTWE